MDTRKRHVGFTLLEMSLVLVIIAFIVGAILGGTALVRAGQIRDMLSEYDGYLKAIKEFQDKYGALPGDMNNATSFWGTDPGGCPAATNTTKKTATCNGDGNGQIGASTTAGVLSSQAEWFRAWQHLSDAGFIPGMLTGVMGPGGASEAVVGVNVPASKLKGAGWTLNYLLMTSGNSGVWNDQYGHLLNLGAYVSTDYTKGAILTPDDAQKIDSKIDDGKPGTGKVRAWRTSMLANCTANDTTQTAATYNTGYTAPACALVFLLGL